MSLNQQINQFPYFCYHNHITNQNSAFLGNPPTLSCGLWVYCHQLNYLYFLCSYEKRKIVLTQTNNFFTFRRKISLIKCLY